MARIATTKHPIGSFSDVFRENYRRARLPLGGEGQETLAYYSLTSVERLRDVLESIGLRDSTLKFDWEDGEGNNPAVGPVLATVGAPVSEQPTGLVDVHGQPITCETGGGVAGRKTADALDPALTDDIVTISVIRVPYDAAARCITGTYTAATNGFVTYWFGDRLRLFVKAAGGTVEPAFIVPINSLMIVISIIDRNGNSTLWTAGGSQSLATPAGAMAGGGVGVGILPSSVWANTGGIMATAWLYGPGRADTFTASAFALCGTIARRLRGLSPRMGGALTFTRATAAAWMAALDRWAISASTGPRAGDGKGILLEPPRINSAFRTIGIPIGALAEWIGDDGSTATGVADIAPLAAANCEAWGPNVVSYANGTGASRYLRCGAATGGVTRRALSVLARIVAGAGAELGWWDTAGPGWSAVGAITDGYSTRTIHQHLVPPSATCVLCIHVPNGCTVYWAAAQGEGSGSATECVATSPIPNTSAIASAARNAETLTLSADQPLVNGGGSVDLYITPIDWSAAEAGTAGMLYGTGSGSPALWVEGGTWRARIDGTTNLDSGVAPAAGIEQHIRLRWATGALQSIDVDGVQVSSAYDGTLYTTGQWQLVPQAPIRVRDARVLQNGGG